MRIRQKGFTLVELLIVVAIIGILAAIAIPNLIAALHRSRQKRTMADIRSIATAWEARATDMGHYNAAGAMSVLALADTDISSDMPDLLVPTYIKILPEKDGWGFDMKYETEEPVGGAPSSIYVIRSAGRDNDFTATASDPGGATTNFNADIIYSNGAFIQYPEGVQEQ